MDSHELAAQVFEKVRPCCVSLSEITMLPVSRSGSLELLNALKALDRELAKSVPSETVLPTALADYIFVPVVELLRKPQITDSELEYTLSIVHWLIVHCWSAPGRLSQALFQQLFPLITFLVGGRPGSNKIDEHSDDTLRNGALCIRDLLSGANKQDNEFLEHQLAEILAIPSVGHCVSILLACSTKDTSVDAKVASLEALGLLFEGIQSGEILALMLPGVVSAMAKIVRAKPHSRIAAEVMNVLAVIIVYVFDDFDLNTQQKGLDGVKDSVNVEIPVHNDKKVKRTTRWLRETLDKLSKAFRIILLSPSPGWLQKSAFRDALFHLNSSILRNCIVTCGPIVPSVLVSLAILSSQDSDVVRNLVDSLTFGKHLDLLKTHMKTTLDEEIGQIGFQLTSPDTEKARSLLSTLSFLVQSLVALNGMDEYLSSSLVEKLHDEITLSVQTANSAGNRKKKLVTNSSYGTEMALIAADYSELSTDVKETNVLSGVFDDSVEKAVVQLLQTVGTGNLSHTLMQDLLFPEQSSSNINYVVDRSISLWMAQAMVQTVPLLASPGNEFLQFDSDDGDDDNALILSDSLEAANDILEANSISEFSSLALVKSSVIALRTIRTCCVSMGESFKEELIDYLYPVVDSLASPNDTIRNEARLAIHQIAEVLYGGSVRTMLYENCDYLLDSLSLKMTGESLTPRLPVILVIIVRIGGSKLLSQLDDVITAIFTLLDAYYGYVSLCEGFFFVFTEIVDLIYKSYFNGFDFDDFSKQSQEDNVLYSQPWGMKSMTEVMEFVNRRPDVDLDLNEDEAEEVDSDDEDPINSDQQHPDVPEDKEEWASPLNKRTYRLLVDILAYSERLAKGNSARLTLLILKLMDRIIPLVATQKSEFLPEVVAPLWPFVSTFVFSSDDPRIITLAIKILKSMLKYGNTFLCTRFVDFFKSLDENQEYKKLTDKMTTVYMKRQAAETKKVINRTSTSVNWEETTFDSICDLYIFAMVKLGRFLPVSPATSMVRVAIAYDPDKSHYGYFDDLAEYTLRQYV